MTQRHLNLWGGTLGDRETMELYNDVESNFNEVYENANLLSKNYADEETAARAGLGYGALYRTDGQVFVRITHMQYPLKGALQLQGYPPVVRLTQFRNPAVVALTLSGVAPVITHQFYIRPPTGSLTATGAAPQLS